MDNKYLFGTIAVLLVVIAGIGFYSVIQHPQETAALPAEAFGAVGDAVQTASSAASGIGASSDDGASQAADKSSASAQTQTTQTQNPGTYTMAQVKTHNSASSCYSAINGSVYDLSQWIDQHPGGQEAILSLCGTDGTQAFEDQHGGQRRPESELASLKIGTLAQ